MRERKAIIAYDIHKDKLRTKVMKKLKNFGVRSQYSFYEFNLTEKMLLRLKSELAGCIESEEDRIIVIELCGNCWEKIERIGFDEPDIYKDTVVI